MKDLKRNSKSGSARKTSTLSNFKRLLLLAILIVPALAFGVLETTGAKNGKVLPAKAMAARTAMPQAPAGRTYTPTTRQPVMVFAPINVSEIAREEALAPSQPTATEIKAINPPAAPPERHFGVPIVHEGLQTPQAPPPSATGTSPGPSQTFSGEFLSGTSIPPDTMGAVGTTHIVTPSNNMIRMQDRNGVQLTRTTLSAFWTGVTLEGGAAVSAFDAKVYFDRFNNRFVMIASANAQSLSSAVLFAATATADPTGVWFRFAIDCDPAATAAGGRWIDYPSVGFNKNWIVINENVFNYGTSGTGYFGPFIYVIDKAALYANAPGAVPLFSADFNATCVPSATPETELACGFTMAPATTEDNTTNTEYLLEDWDATLAQLRLSKITGTAAAPVLTIGTQFPQSPNSWRFNALRIGTTGGYAPQRQQSAHLTSGARIMTNDSRIQNSVYRNGSLWAAHTVMLSTVPQPAGTDVGGAGNPANPDNHSGIQWWEIDPTIETGLSTAPLQRARIEDATADNCHNGTGGTVATPPCNNSTLNQHGQFYAFPSISVNQNEDVLIGFSQFSNLTYASGGYVFRSNTDPPNTTRDFVVFRPGQANYNIGAGSGAARQDRWGDYSQTQTDPLNDIDFWTIQEYAGAQRDFGIGIAGPWETWWALVKPSTPAPSLVGNLIISEFRLRGPQGVNDEFVELHNPGTTPLMVSTTDNSDGWALGFSTTAGVISGVAVIPNGTVIPAKGNFLIARNQDPANGPTLVYSLNTYAGQTNPSTLVRGADSDTGYAVDLPDNGGLALFKTSTVANFSVATRMDSVGFASTPVGLFKEGTGIPDTAVAGLQQTFFRSAVSGLPKDTDNNAADFVFADPTGTLTPAGQRLGAPGPENLDSPLHNLTGNMILPVFDNSVSAATAPNFVFNATPVANGTAGTITVRRRLVNNTGAPISRVRLRFVDITTFPQPVGIADLRVLNSSNVTVETPPAQALGGGLNSSVAPPIVTFAAPIPNGGNVPIDLVFGIMQTGCFRFIVTVEALPGGAKTVFGFAGVAGAGTCAPTAAPANISGRITDAAGSPLGGVLVNLTGARTAQAITDSNGNYRFSNIETGNFYTVTPSLTNYHFSPENTSFSLLANKTDAVFTATRDAVIVGNAIDTPEYFVRQHYVDFLGREPDPSGFAFWSDQIRSCGSDADCIERRTINVSAAYFLSGEFQETGGVVDKLYRASYGRRPLFAEFMPDAATVGQGVIVGGEGDWAGLLNANKQAFIAAWVQRPEFVSTYGGLGNGAYVDTLLRHTGVSFSQGERDAFVSALSSGSTRADVLRQIVENSNFVNAKRNEMFVMMQYFGYLRRDPDEGGYRFWLNKLNQFGGNFEQAEMVKAFIVSGEYRSRFAH